MIGMTYGYLVILKALSRCILPSSYMDLKLLSYRGSESLKSTLALNKPKIPRIFGDPGRPNFTSTIS